MPDLVALVRLPDVQGAPGYRDSLAQMARFAVDDLGGGIVAVAPTEGPGATAQHFALTKLCDAQSDLTDPATWAPLRSHPPRKRSDVDGTTYRNEMIKRSEEITGRDSSAAAQIEAFALVAMGAAQADDLENLLSVQLPPLFADFPRARCGR